MSIEGTRKGNILACSLAGRAQFCMFLPSFLTCPPWSGRRRGRNEAVS